MPAIIFRILSMILGSIIAKVLLGAGLAFVTYGFINDLVSEAQNQMIGLMNNIPADILGVLSILKIPQALSIIMSAIGMAAFIKTSKIAIGLKS